MVNKDEYTRLAWCD